MLADFAIVDATTIRALSDECHIEVDGRAFAIGPLVETLIFRRRSLKHGGRINLSLLGSVGEAFRRLPQGLTWAVSLKEDVGILRIQHGKPTEHDELQAHQFLLKLLQNASAAGMPKQAAQALSGAAGELIDNIKEHAGPGENALAAFAAQKGSLWLTVGDAGLGMLPTYVHYPEVKSAKEALRMAVVEHCSSTGDPERGMGFRKLLRSLSSLDASLRVRTGDASLECEGSAGARPWVSREQVQLVGCVVSAHLRW